MQSNISAKASNGLKIFTMLVLGMLIGLASKGIVYAATTVTSPGTCFKGGTTIQLSWTLDPTAAHGYHSIWQGSSQPTYANGQPPIVGGHFATSPINWSLPLVTAGGYQSHVESHTPGHSVISSAESAPFAIDSTDPVAPALTAGSATTSSVVLSWNAVSDSGCMGLSGYKLYRGAQLISTTTGTTFTDTGLTASTGYSYSVVAYDGFASSPSSNIVTKSTTSAPVAPAPTPTPAASPSPQSAPATVITPTSPPTTTTTRPTGKLSCTSISSTTIDLLYQSSDTTVSGLFRGTLLVAKFNTANKSGTYHDSGLTATTSYDYTLRAGTDSKSTLLASIACKTGVTAPIAAPSATEPAKPPISQKPKPIVVPSLVTKVPIITPKSDTITTANPQYRTVRTVASIALVPLIAGGALLVWQFKFRKHV